MKKSRDSGVGIILRPFPAVALLCMMLLCTMPNVLCAEQTEITVSAAASLTNAFKEIGDAFQSNHKGVRVLFNFAASGDLLRQIEGGAPVDVFASAAPREMDQLESKAFIVAGTRRVFAENVLVLAKPKAPPTKLDTFEDLRRPGIKRIAIGSPSSVPAGMYAEQTLRYYKVWDDVKDKLVFGESVRQVLDYVARGEVDAGLVFSTDAKAREKEVMVVTEPVASSHSPILYPIAVVKGTKNEDTAKAFVQFVSGEQGQKILKAYGFRSPASGRR